MLPTRQILAVAVMLAATAGSARGASAAPATPSELAMVAPELRLRWDAGHAPAIAALKAVFQQVGEEQTLTTQNGHVLGVWSFTGTVQGFEQCSIMAMFRGERLDGLEVVIPPQRGLGASKLFQQVMATVLAKYQPEILNAGFDVRRGDAVEIELRGPGTCTPELIGISLKDPTDAKVDQGTLKAEGFVLLKAGGLIKLQTPSAGIAARNPLYQVGSLVIDVRAFDPAAIAAASAELAAEPGPPPPHRSDAEEADYELPAIKELKRKAEAGELAARRRLAAMYVEGDELPRDRAAAIRWCQRALDQGDEAAAFKLATLYCNRWYSFYPPFSGTQPTPEEYRKAAALLERAGKGGNGTAWMRLAELYRDGSGVKQDAVAYRASLDKAAALGNEEAHYELSRLEARNPQVARLHLEEAARHGHAFAGLELAQASSNPAPWLECVAKAGQNYDANAVIDARMQLSKLYETGKGVPKDAVEALKWMLVAQDLYPPGRRSEFDDDLAPLRARLAAADVAEAERRARAWIAAYTTQENAVYPF